jgi:hypothetical protein
VTSFPDLIQWLAFGIGAFGSLLWAHNGRWSKYAGLFWLAGSLLWIWFAHLSGMPGLAARDAIAVLTTAWGTWRWLGVDRRRGGGRRAADRAPSAEVAARRREPAQQRRVVDEPFGDQMHDLAFPAQHAKHS